MARCGSRRSARKVGAERRSAAHPDGGTFVINDGQHRRAAIEAALRENPDLGDETIAVVFFLDVGLKRCQQMFADLNRYAIRPTTSLGILYDHRDEDALDRQGSPSAGGRLHRSHRNRAKHDLQPLDQAVHTERDLPRHADSAGRPDEEPLERRSTLLRSSGTRWASTFPDWELAKQRKVSPPELRRDYIHAHGLALHALARVGKRAHSPITPATGRQSWHRSDTLDWSRSNTELWEGRAMNAGRLSKKR